MVHDRLEQHATSDGDHVTLARMGVAIPGVPHLLVLHGLEGTVRAKYAHGLLARARTLGWSGDLFLFRSCDGLENTAPRLYHSGETEDLDGVIRRLRRDAPETPLFICGVSLGGNVLLKWLGERGQEAAHFVRRAAAVSVPFDLAAGSRQLEHGFSRLYAAHFLKTLKPKAFAKAARFPGVIDPEAVRRARTFWDFDDAATAPLHGFRDAADYYARSSSIHFLRLIRVPTLLMSAMDDPFVPRDVLDGASSEAGRSDWLHAEFTSRGGHVGWVEGRFFPTSYYMEEAAIQYLHDGLMMA